MYIFDIFLTFHFLIKIRTTVSGGNSKKFEVMGSDKGIHQSMQFSMLILNMIVLLHRSFVLMMKMEIYRQKSCFFDQTLVKVVVFLNNEKKREKKRCITL
jgi:hypothetical protein